jgi:hypothetical protein
MRSISSYGDDEGDRWPHKRSDKIAARWGSQGDNVAIDKDVPALQCAGIGELGCHGDDGDFQVGNALPWSVRGGSSNMDRPFIDCERGFGPGATFIERARWRSSIRSRRTPSPPD